MADPNWRPASKCVPEIWINGMSFNGTALFVKLLTNNLAYVTMKAVSIQRTNWLSSSQTPLPPISSLILLRYLSPVALYARVNVGGFWQTFVSRMILAAWVSMMSITGGNHDKGSMA